MKQRFLCPGWTISKAFRREAQKLVPQYKVQLRKAAMQVPSENSSPVCYANAKGLREGFEDQV